jgi:hypothetical protein
VADILAFLLALNQSCAAKEAAGEKITPPGMRVKLREDLKSDELPAERSTAPMPPRSPGQRLELSLQARGAKRGAELRGTS